MVKEKFYDLLQELIEYEVTEIVRRDHSTVNLKELENLVKNIDNRLGGVERRLATLSRMAYNDGK